MNKKDLIFSIISGLVVAWVASDFSSKYGWYFFIILPILSIVGLYVVEIVGKKYLSVHQAGKFVLIGSFAGVVDVKVFQLLIIFAPLPLLFKAVSFLVATYIKYFINKGWVFEKHEGSEAIKFFLVTLIGLAINVVAFYFFTQIQTGISEKLWVELSIILAAVVAASWNFLGYKFLVFKK